MSQMIIANRLTDGLVVFFKGAGQWTTHIAEGLIIPDAEGGEATLVEARNDEVGCLILDPQLIDVELSDEGPRPTAIREAIRAFGPTT